MSRIWGGAARIAGRRSTLVTLGIVVGALFVPHGAAFAVKSVQDVFIKNGVANPVPTSEQNVDGNGDIETSDASARRAVRYEGTDGFATNNQVIVPDVPEGKTFLISYVNVSGGSAISGTEVTGAECTLSREHTDETGTTTTQPLAALPVTLTGLQGIAVSERMSLPLLSGESLIFNCRIDPEPQSGIFRIRVVGHYIPAT